MYSLASPFANCLFLAYSLPAFIVMFTLTQKSSPLVVCVKSLVASFTLRKGTDSFISPIFIAYAFCILYVFRLIHLLHWA
jgi:hypothetical protein